MDEKELQLHPCWVLLRPDDVAQRLNISRSMVYQLLGTKQLPCVRIGHAVRVRQEDLDQFVLDNISG